MNIDIKKCARCGQDHDQLEFKALSIPEKYTHWGWCPTNAEPVMMTVTFEAESKDHKVNGFNPS